jgi:hypothetical protein
MQLPVFDIITEACRDIWEGRRDFASFAFLPVLVVAIAGTLMGAVIGDPRVLLEDPAEVPPPVIARIFFGILVNWLAAFAMYTVFAIAWHRRTLVGREASTIGAAMRWGPRQWRFFRRLVLLIVNLMLLTFFLSLFLMRIIPLAPLLSALLIVVGLIYARVALILPAAATDTPMTFAESAKLTKGNSWRMMLAVVLLPLAVMLFGGLVVLLVAAPLAALIGSSITAQFVLSLVTQSVNYAGFAVGITALSIAYKQLTA